MGLVGQLLLVLRKSPCFGEAKNGTDAVPKQDASVIRLPRKFLGTSLAACEVHMAAQTETSLKTASSDAVGVRNRPIASRRFSRFLILVLCILAGCVTTVGARAEENSILAGAVPSLANLSLNLALVSNQALFGTERRVRLSFDTRFSTDLKDLAAEREKGSSLPKSILRKQLVWISDGPRAKVRPGFGPFFRGETVEPLRCNGAGVEDSRYLFVKLSFRF
jgi:hypothetical protein